MLGARDEKGHKRKVCTRKQAHQLTRLTECDVTMGWPQGDMQQGNLFILVSGGPRRFQEVVVVSGVLKDDELDRQREGKGS